ncbi:MAG: multiprotein-bridging factor 1 family protein [Dehalococcoidia bacterium]
MRTTAFAPPFPTDLGTWLAAFRHRVTNARGHPSSPEQLGKQIGVSGATVRRWEAGRLRPRAEDAANLARACNLTTMQVAFLSRALRTGGPMPVPDLDTFRRKATPILTGEFPTYIMDSLMFIRAWNSYLPRFLERKREGPHDYHFIDFIIDTDEHAGVQPALQQRVEFAAFELWFLTADACGTSEYVALINRLSKYEAFRESWQRIPFLDEDECPEIGLPRRASRPDVGSCLIAPFAAIMPPVYQVRQFYPMDSAAQQRLHAIRSAGAPTMAFDTKSHWAQTAEDEAFVRVGLS